MDVQDYLDLIPAPNSIQANFMAWVEDNLQIPVDIQTCLNSINDALTIDNAVGPQLDVVGAILGLSRQVNFNPGGGATSIMVDEVYRIALKAKIVQNQWKGTKQEIYEFWSTLLPQYPVLIQDNQDMSMSVLVVGMPNDVTGSVYFGYDTETSVMKGYDEGYWEPFVGILRGLVTHGYFTPKPAGVSVSYQFLEGVAFGYDMDTPLIQGYDLGSWVQFS